MISSTFFLMAGNPQDPNAGIINLVFLGAIFLVFYLVRIGYLPPIPPIGPPIAPIGAAPAGITVPTLGVLPNI